MNYTSIEQSKKLLSLGLNAESADMLYTWDTDNNTYYPLPIVDDKEHDFPSGLPCWSVGALLGVMLRGGCTWALREERSMDIQIRKDGHNEDRWTGVCNSYLEAVFNMVVWLLKNGYIKKE